MSRRFEAGRRNTRRHRLKVAKETAAPNKKKERALLSLLVLVKVAFRERERERETFDSILDQTKREKRSVVGGEEKKDRERERAR